MSKGLWVSVGSVVLFCGTAAQTPQPNEGIYTIYSRIAPPAGFQRVPAALGSFAHWLRNFPLKPGRPDVRLFNGKLKDNQTAHLEVLNIDVGNSDLQQCADAVIRLRAEYLRLAGKSDEVAFNFTSGDRFAWVDWRRGVRPVVSGNHVTWRTTAEPDDSPASFRRYLDTIFTYAGSQSLEREMVRVGEKPVEIGDVFIQGGFPGHAVIVMDVAENASASRKFLLAQSYMPAQDIHILINPAEAQRDPWYTDNRNAPLRTPEWTFPARSLRRFK